MKKFLTLLSVLVALNVSAQSLKTSNCKIPPAPTVGATTFSHVTSVYCPNDSMNYINISVADKYSNAPAGAIKYVFKFTGITNTSAGCQDVASYLPSWDGKVAIYFGKCFGCFTVGQTYGVSVQSICSNGYGTNFSAPKTFTIQPAKK